MFQDNMHYNTQESMQIPNSDFGSSPPINSSFTTEDTILEELGIDFNLIINRTKQVINPVMDSPVSFSKEADLVGPLVLCLLLGSILLLGGKSHFGYIYGLSILSCLGIYLLLGGLAPQTPQFMLVVSVLGYSILPLLLLATLGIFVSINSYAFGSLITLISVVWCTLSSSRIFAHSLDMKSQQLLIAYPCGLVYGIFALLTIF